MSSGAEKKPVLQMERISRSFTQGGNNLTILKDVSFTIHQGEMVALVGPSGCGKSTLLHIAGLLDRPTSGDIWIKNKKHSQSGENKRTMVRRNDIGVVYQQHHLLPDFSALDNVAMPQIIAGKSLETARKAAAKLLDEMGLAERQHHRPPELSGGEQQRVAIVRALCNKPSLLLADEPTGNLDPSTADSVFSLLRKVVKDRGVAMLMVTHDMDLAMQMKAQMTLEDGVLVKVKKG